MILPNSSNSSFGVKDVRRRRTTVILASRAAPPLAAGSQKMISRCFFTMKRSKKYKCGSYQDKLAFVAVMVGLVPFVGRWLIKHR